MKNIILSRATGADIESQVRKVLRGLGNPEPPLDLDQVRDLLKLDRRYYSTTDDSFLQEMISRLTVAGRQILQRPSLLRDAIRSFDLRALYVPDRRRILLDAEQPGAKQRWNESHEIGHSLIPWHADLMLGDQEQTLSKDCHDQIEAEANYAAGQLLFLQERFVINAHDMPATIASIQVLKSGFGNSLTTTFWRFIETSHTEIPMFGLIGGHPRKSPPNVNETSFRHVVESPAFKQHFATPDLAELRRDVARYCGTQRAGPLGTGEKILTDRNGTSHIFEMESFFNRYDCLTLAVRTTVRRPLVQGWTTATVDL